MARRLVRLSAVAKPLSGISIAALLVLVPNALGLVLRILPELFLRFSTWSYHLEILPIPFFILSLGVIVYLFTVYRRSRATQQVVPEPEHGKERKFLPPLELVLIEIGNFTFLIFAAVLALLILVVLLSFLRAIVTNATLAANSLVVSLAVAAIFKAASLRSGALEAQSWKTISRDWLKWSSLYALAIAGFGIVAATSQPGPLRIHLTESQLPPRTLATFYLILILLLGLDFILAGVGRRRAPESESRRPSAWFIPAFTLAWIVSLGLLTLFLYGAMLTLQGHLAAV